MSLQGRRELVCATADRYRKADRREKARILDEFTAATGCNRKYAIGLLRNPICASNCSSRRNSTDGKRSRRRKRLYTPAVCEALVQLWKVANRPCSKRLAPFLPELMESLERHGELCLTEDVRHLLQQISPATCDRLLAEVRRKSLRRGLSTTKPGTLLRNQIPIRTFADWKESERRPGFTEGDLVAHCGESTHGEYLHTLVVTDVHCGWTEFEALLNRAQRTTQDGLDAIRQRLPFALLGFDSDNGSEFINNQLKRYCDQAQITFTRCRPYKKNDQCHVEQKNWSIVRQMVGYDRLEGERAERLLEAVYAPLRLYINFFQPVLKLKEKHREAAKVVKRYDQAQTPYRRLLAAGILTREQREDLEGIRQCLNPADLMRKIEAAQERLWRWARATAPLPASEDPSKQAGESQKIT